jgi:hypothetical protein
MRKLILTAAAIAALAVPAVIPAASLADNVNQGGQTTQVAPATPGPGGFGLWRAGSAQQITALYGYANEGQAISARGGELNSSLTLAQIAQAQAPATP